MSLSSFLLSLFVAVVIVVVVVLAAAPFAATWVELSCWTVAAFTRDGKAQTLSRQGAKVICSCLRIVHVGLVAKASASRAADPGFDSRLRRDISGLTHTGDLKIGTPVATLPGVIGSAQGLVGPVSLCCDWVK